VEVQSGLTLGLRSVVCGQNSRTGTRSSWARARANALAADRRPRTFPAFLSYFFPSPGEYITGNCVMFDPSKVLILLIPSLRTSSIRMMEWIGR
jgi:hypothetical protein